MNDLILFSLPNGAELIGALPSSYVGINIDYVYVEHPLVIRPIQRGPNDFALDLFPHSLSNPEGTHKFTKSQIISMSENVPTHLEKAYRERTSNIVIAQTLNDWEHKLK